MLPDGVSNPGPLTYESSALPIALRGPAHFVENSYIRNALFPIFKILRSQMTVSSMSLIHAPKWHMSDVRTKMAMFVVKRSCTG